MNVLHIITSLGTGGAEKLLADSIPLYRQQGINAEILVLNGRKHPFFLKLKKENIPVYSLSKGNLNKIYNPLNIFMLIPWIGKYDIVHVHLFPSLYWVVLAKVISCTKTVLIYTEHNTSNRRMGIKLLNKLEAYIYNKYDRIVSITEEIQEIQRRRFPRIEKEKFRVIHNGIDLSTYKKGHKTTTGTGTKILIQVSSFRSQKDQETLIRAMKHLPGNIILLLVGDGENKTRCEELVISLSLSGRVSFLGIRQDIPALLSSADIVVLSSHYEGLSLSCIEGMASGCPFIASAVPGLKEIVSGAGLLFPEGDDKALADIIRQLLSDKNLYNKVVERCRERAKKYDIRAMACAYADLYKDVTG